MNDMPKVRYNSCQKISYWRKLFLSGTLIQVNFCMHTMTPFLISWSHYFPFRRGYSLEEPLNIFYFVLLSEFALSLPESLIPLLKTMY